MFAHKHNLSFSNVHVIPEANFELLKTHHPVNNSKIEQAFLLCASLLTINLLVNQ